MNEMTVVALQMTARPGDLEGNVDRFAALVRRHAEGADLVVAPELMTSGYDLELLARQGAELAEALDGPTVKRATRLAVETGATLTFGILEADTGRLYDTVAVVRPDESVTPYRKTHLYPAELDLFGAGDELVVAATPHGDVGLMICFEHAFPEVATTLAVRGAQVLAIPSAVPDGFEHLLSLRTRARAQDNQVFAVGCNLAGYGFCGRSLLVNPRGDVIASAGADEAVLRATINLAEIDRERSTEPALRLRRTSLYDRGPG